MNGWDGRRWLAIGAGFIGVLIILRPGPGVFSPLSLLAFLSAAMFAVYVLLTRYASRRDSARTSFFWLGTAGAIFATAGGVWFLEPMAKGDWIWMAILCMSGATGHYLLIKCYEVSEAGVVQPFAYLHMVFGSLIGLAVFGEMLEMNVIVGGRHHRAGRAVRLVAGARRDRHCQPRCRSPARSIGVTPPPRRIL